MEKYLYGVDLGGTTVKLGLFTLTGELIEKFQIPTDTTNNGENILPDIKDAIFKNMEKHKIDRIEIKGIGIGVPGPVSNGIVNRCVNLGWGVVNVKEILCELTKINVIVSNDANVAGLGELWKGGGLGCSNLVFITLGTGVGGAVILDNKIIEGCIGAGGEIGHAPTIDSEFLCNCGNISCLETVVSATGVVRLTKKYLNETQELSVLRNKVNLSAKDVFDAAKNNDPIALKTINNFGKNLGYICAVIGATINPQAFVFGGGVSKAGEIILEYVKKYFKNYAFFALQETTEFKLAKLGNDAGIYGCAFLAKQL